MDLFASNLKKRAQQLGISNAEVARRSGLSERRYGNYVTGRREPDLATLAKIARVLETTPNELLGFEANPKPTKRSLLKDRLNAAANVMSEEKLEMTVIQAEAIAIA